MANKKAEQYQLQASDRWRGLRTEIDMKERLSVAIVHAVFLILVLLVLLALHGWMVERDLADAERIGRESGERERVMAEDKAERMSKALAACLNGGAIPIKGTRDAIFCDRASYQKGL